MWNAFCIQSVITLMPVHILHCNQSPPEVNLWRYCMFNCKTIYQALNIPRCSIPFSKMEKEGNMKGNVLDLMFDLHSHVWSWAPKLVSSTENLGFPRNRVRIWSLRRGSEWSRCSSTSTRETSTIGELFWGRPTRRRSTGKRRRGGLLTLLHQHFSLYRSDAQLDYTIGIVYYRHILRCYYGPVKVYD